MSACRVYELLHDVIQADLSISSINEEEAPPHYKVKTFNKFINWKLYVENVNLVILYPQINSVSLINHVYISDVQYIKSILYVEQIK